MATEVDLRALDLRGEGGTLPGQASSSCWWRPTARPGILPLRPEGRPEAPPRHPGAAAEDLVPHRARVRAAAREATRRRSWCATCARAGWARSSTSSRCRTSPSSGSRPRSSPIPARREARAGSGRPPGGAARVRAGRGALLPVRGLRGAEGRIGHAAGGHGLRGEARRWHRRQARRARRDPSHLPRQALAALPLRACRRPTRGLRAGDGLLRPASSGKTLEIREPFSVLAEGGLGPVSPGTGS